MVARAPDVPSYAHLILPSQEEEFVGLSPGPVYYDLSQSCCPRSGGGYGGGRGGVDGGGGGGGEMSLASGGGGGRTTALQSSPPDSRDQPSKKRKAPSTHEGSDDDTGDDCKSVRTDDHKKQNHSEIEKRRRDKMNTYITELSAMVPMCHALSRKLDKLTVLRMAVQHMKAIRGAVASYTDGSYKPAFLSDLHLKKLIKQAAEGFLFVVGCDRGRILYVSESVSQSLNYTQSDLLGQSWFDILHPKDVAKVKEQLSSSHLSPRERFIDAKTMLPVKAEVPASGARLSPGARRSFFCRMKCRSVTTTVKEEADTTTGFHRRKKQQAQHVSDKKYRVIHCTGYLKPWGSGGDGGGKLGGGGGGRGEEDEEKEGESSSLSCLVAMGRVVLVPLPHPRPPHRSYLAPISLRPLQFVSRHAMDGKFLFVDQRATLVLGFLPQELLGTSMYEYYYKEDICHLAESHKAALQSKEPVTTKIYRFRSKDGNYVQLQSEWRSFRNPWTKEGEYLVAKNSRLTTSMDPQVESSIERTEGSTSQASGNYEYFSTAPSDDDVEIPTFLDNGSEIPKFISSNVEASHIGRQISEEVQDELRKSSGGSPSSTNQGRTPSPSVAHQTTAAGAGGGVVGHPPQLLEVGPNLPSSLLLPMHSSSSSSASSSSAGLPPASLPVHHPPPQTANTHLSRLFNDFTPPPDEEIMSVLVTINRVGKVNPKWDSVGSYPYPLSPPASLEGRKAELETKLHSGIFPDRVSVSGENSSQSLCQRKGTTDEASYPPIRNNVTLSSLGSDTGGEGEEMLEMMGSAVSPPEAAPSDGNDEAAMAVIMCLLEADAGLGGPVDFTGLPWPLP